MKSFIDNNKYPAITKSFKTAVDLLGILVIGITKHENLASRAVYGPLPSGDHIPEPALEPGMHVRYGVNGTEQDVLVGKVNFKAYGYKHHPGWRYHPPDSDTSLDKDLIKDSWWPEQGQFPDFKKGKEFYIRLPYNEDPIKIIIMTQTSLVHGAHVLFVREEANVLYSMPKSRLERILVDVQNPDNAQNPEVQAALRR